MIDVHQRPMDSCVNTDQDQLVVLPNAAETVRPAVAAYVIECYGGDERRMALTPRNYPLLPWRINSDQVILTASLSKAHEHKIGSIHPDLLTRM